MAFLKQERLEETGDTQGLEKETWEGRDSQGERDR